MKIFISEADRQSARRIVIQNIARLYNLSGWKSELSENLLNEIYALRENSAIMVSGLLKNYFNAYDNWFAFYQQRQKIESETGIEYNLNNNEQVELEQLIKRRQCQYELVYDIFSKLEYS